MATRADVSVDFFLDPRVVRVAAPSTEIVIQDLHDTVRNIEDEPRFMQYGDLISTAGKENLGGGITVGLTATLKNAVIAFDARKQWTSAGTVTTNDLSGRTLIDSGADFVSDGVEPGAWVVNMTDFSISSVITVVSLTEILTDGLGGGTGDTFTTSDEYRILNVTQCEVSGGNLVAVGSDLVTSLDPVLPTVGTQVVTARSSSATLQELLEVQYDSFGGLVTVNGLSPFSGTSYPVGTLRQPVNNLGDAKLIATERGFRTIQFIGDYTTLASDSFDSFLLLGEGKNRSLLTFNTDSTFDNCEVRDATVQGDLDDDIVIRNCILDGLNFKSARVLESFLKGTMSVSGAGDTDIIDCTSFVSGVTTPIIDLTGKTGSFSMRGYRGGITLRNKSNADAISIDLGSGQIILEATVTAGTIVCRGVGKLTDNSSGATVIDELVDSRRIILIEKIQKNRLETNPSTGVLTVYDDDGVTPLISGQIYQDVAGTTPYDGNGVDRRDALS
jgi:hypothetical protein